MSEEIEQSQVEEAAPQPTPGAGIEVLTEKLEYAQIIINIVQAKLNEATSELIQHQAKFKLLSTKQAPLEKKVEIAENQLAVTTKETKEKIQALELSVKESREGNSEVQQREISRKDKELADVKANGQKRLEDAETYLKKFQRDSEQQIKNAKAAGVTEIENLKGIISDNAAKEKLRHEHEMKIIIEQHQKTLSNTQIQSETFKNESKKFKNENASLNSDFNIIKDQLNKKIKFWEEDKKSDQTIIGDYAILLDEAREKIEELDSKRKTKKL